MDTIQILSILRKTIGQDLLGVFPSDKFPTTTDYSDRFGFVLNTDPSDKPGTHWVAIFIEGNSAEYFDSYGLPPTIPTIRKFLQKFGELQYNKRRIQGLLSSVCGHYCIYFLIQRWHGTSLEEILNKFSSDCNENDENITEWLNDNFDIDTETFDIDFLVNQICHAIE